MAYVDGIDSALLPVDDRGLQYGDGLFETLALIERSPQHWARHYARLQAGAARLGIVCPDATLWLHDLAAAASHTSASLLVAKLILTRGSGGRGYTPPPHTIPRRIVQISPWPVWPGIDAARGVRVALCETRLGRNRSLAGLKHLNRLEQVLGSAELARDGADEGLMFDDLDQLIEGTRSNVFLVHKGVLLTPRLDEAGIAGVMRAVILDLAQSLSIPLHETAVTRAQLAQADEVFLCNSLIGLWPVREIMGPAPQRFDDFSLCQHLASALQARALVP